LPRSAVEPLHLSVLNDIIVKECRPITPTNKAFVGQTVEPTGGKPSSNNLFGRQCWLWLWCEI